MKLQILTLSLLVAGAMAITSCSGNAKTDEANNDSAATATEQTTDQAAPASALGTAEEGVIMYTANQNIEPQSIPVIIDFNAPWCGPCHKFVPTFHKIAQEFEGKAIFMEVDIDANPVTRDQFVEGNAIPQVTILMPDGTKTDKKGLMKEDEFRALVQGALK